VRLSGFPAWLVWMFVHLTFLEGYANRVATLARWLRSMIGRGRPEREFPVRHVGGDLSLPESVRKIVEPAPFLVLSRQTTQPAPTDGQGSNGPS
jgi:NADH:ubiquinone reductase (H+-translocating)